MAHKLQNERTDGELNERLEITRQTDGRVES